MQNYNATTCSVALFKRVSDVAQATGRPLVDGWKGTLLDRLSSIPAGGFQTELHARLWLDRQAEDLIEYGHDE